MRPAIDNYLNHKKQSYAPFKANFGSAFLCRTAICGSAQSRSKIVIYDRCEIVLQNARLVDATEGEIEIREDEIETREADIKSKEDEIETKEREIQTKEGDIVKWLGICSRFGVDRDPGFRN